MQPKFSVLTVCEFPLVLSFICSYFCITVVLTDAFLYFWLLHCVFCSAKFVYIELIQIFYC